MGRFTPPAQSGGRGTIVLGVIVGAILGGVLLCVAVDVAAGWEQQSIERETRDGVASGQTEEEAHLQAIMRHPRNPITATMELGVAVVFGGGIGGFLAAKWSRRSAEQEESSVAWRVVGYQHSPDPLTAGSTAAPPVE